jgi:cation transport ATPase
LKVLRQYLGGHELNAWSSFFQGELGAAAALAGLLFVSVSVNQTRILELGRMADRGLEALVILLLVLVTASLPLMPGQPLRLLGAEILLIGLVTFVVLIAIQRIYFREVEPAYRSGTATMMAISLFAVSLIAFAGLIMVWSGEDWALYLLGSGMLLSFIAAGANAWVLLIEINR